MCILETPLLPDLIFLVALYGHHIRTTVLVFTRDYVRRGGFPSPVRWPTWCSLSAPVWFLGIPPCPTYLDLGFMAAVIILFVSPHVFSYKGKY